MKTARTMRENLNEEFISHINKKYKSRFDALRQIVPGTSDESNMKLGILLENIEDRLLSAPLLESTQMSNIRDGLKTQYFDIVTNAWAGLIADRIFSVQPLQQKQGQIFYMKYTYGKKKGRINKGDTIFGPYGDIAGYENSNYTSELVEDEPLFATDGTTTDFTGNFDYIPMTPGTLEIDVLGTIATDNGNGVISGAGISSGTVNYETGEYDIKFTTAPAVGDVTIDYEYDLSYAPSTIPEIDVNIVDTFIQARPRKLKGTYSLDAGYDLKQAQGINIEDALLEAASAQLQHETDGDLIMDAFNRAGFSTTWDGAYNNQTQHMSRKDFYEDFIDTLIKASSNIRQSTKRVEANWIVVGKKASDILTFIGAPRYVSAGNTNAVGPHYAGKLDGKWDVYINPFFDEDAFLMGYKGDILADAGMIYAPYLPFYATDPIMLDDFLGRRGFATSYGKKMVNNKMFVKGTLLNI